MSYNRPIITEIYADLYLQPGTLSMARLFDLVPQLLKVGFPIVEPGDAEIEGSRIQPVRCWSEDRQRLVQLVPDNIVMNLVSPDGTYPGWDMFIRSVIQPALRAVSAVASPWFPQSISLNTLDRAVVAPLSSFRLGDYLNCGGPRIPEVLADTSVAFDYDVGRGAFQVDARNRQLHINGRPLRDTYAIGMHCVFHERISSESEIVPTLQELHEESNRSFESLVTDQMRNKVMKGTVHAGTRV